MTQTIDITKVTHCFSRNIAKEYGVNAALVFGYISHKIHTSKNIVNGKHWYYATVDQIAQVYPYLKRTAVYEALRSLTSDNGLLIAGCYNKKSYDRTTWYAFRTKEVAKLAEISPIYFKVLDAVHYDVAKAVLLSNLRYWIDENRKTNPGYNLHAMSPTQLADMLPFSKATIQRKLRELVEVEGELASVAALDGRDPALYGFLEEVTVTVDCFLERPKSAEMPIKLLNDYSKAELPQSESQNTITGGSNPVSCSLRPE
jgi:hypothetical protein